MENLQDIVIRAQKGDMDAFEQLVRCYQDMAYGYAYSILGDFHLAKDAAQKAFLDAYHVLSQLQKPLAFPSWLRRIVLKHCDRITRRKRIVTVNLDNSPELIDPTEGPAHIAEQNNLQELVMQAVRSLPEHQRTTTTLYYINGYSQQEVAEFLEVPVTTVKKRLYDSRKSLKERMMTMVASELKQHTLSSGFPERIRILLESPRSLQIEGHPIHELWQKIRTCFADYEYIELDEMCSSSVIDMGSDVAHDQLFKVDNERYLRAELTTLLLNKWLEQGGGACKWITVGRVFRDEEPSDGELQVFYQVEVFWCEKGLTSEMGRAAVFNTAECLLPGLPFRDEVTYSYFPVKDGREYEAQYKDEWYGVAGGGMFDEIWMSKVGMATDDCNLFGFALG